MKSLLTRILIVVSLLLVSSGVVRASSTEIRAHIAAVRIIVVDEHQTVNQIYQNTNQDLLPDVRLHSVSGKQLAYSSKIAQQDYAYRQKLPSLIETLYAML